MIGKSIWRFDCNRRVYRKNEKGQSVGGPIYREHWVQAEVIGETTSSWLVGYASNPCKVPKKGPRPLYAFTELEVEDACWVNSHRPKIAEIIYGIRDPDILRAVARVIGFNPGDTK